MRDIVIKDGTTTVTVTTGHDVTVTEKKIIIDLIATSTKTNKTAKRRGRPLGSKDRTTRKTVKK
tara:strand:+ start:139 stop:330 length:192 start_codon:yes stop_codon:yes gene_type:complete